MRSILIAKPGPLSTIQDRGRYGYRSWGVPQCGAMDSQALRVGNLLVGNSRGAAGIEITMGGFHVEFQCSTHFALTGDLSGALLNGTHIDSWRAHPAKRGDFLVIDNSDTLHTGLRTYLSISGGIEVPEVMNSRSTYLRGEFGGTGGRALRSGDELPLGTPAGPPEDFPAPSACIPSYSPEPVLRVVPGPQDDRISPNGGEVFYSEPYLVTERADRMGIALSGPVIDLPCGADIISDGTCPGAVQVHGNGQPTILGADCQTTGGYIKICVVISTDLPLVAQLVPGSRVRFTQVDLWQAREIYMQNEYLVRNFIH